jgi:hypothetical protein
MSKELTSEIISSSSCDVSACSPFETSSPVILKPLVAAEWSSGTIPALPRSNASFFAGEPNHRYLKKYPSESNLEIEEQKKEIKHGPTVFKSFSPKVRDEVIRRKLSDEEAGKLIDQYQREMEQTIINSNSNGL